MSEAVRWFREHPEAAKLIKPLSEDGREAIEEAQRLGPLPKP